MRSRTADAAHKKLFIRLMKAVYENVTIEESTIKEDLRSVADMWLGNENCDERTPVGLKNRGVNSGEDFNLSAWSAQIGLLDEFATAGDKLYFYSTRDGHYLVQMPPQVVLNKYLLTEDEWKLCEAKRLRLGKRVNMFNQYAGVRSDSEYSNVPQGFIFVPKHLVKVLLRWDKDGNLIENNMIT